MRVRTRRRLPRFRALAAAAAASLALAGCASSGHSAPGGAPARSTVAVAQTLAASLGAAIIDSAGALLRDTVLLDADTAAASWLARTELAAALRSTGRTVLLGGTDGPGRSSWKVRGISAEAAYRDIRREGFFSAPVVDRIVTVSFSSEIATDGVVIFSGRTAAASVDTVAEGEIGSLAAGSSGIGQGAVPSLRAIDRFVEPVVIIGAAGAAIFLFFQVRS